MMLSGKRLLPRLRRDRRGFVAVWFALTLTTVMGLSAAVIDWGRLLVARRALQAATDAAALAGAAAIPDGTGLATATSWSATTGNRNAMDSVTMVSGFPQLRCFTSINVPCAAPANANGIVVRQRVTVNTMFARLIGLNSMSATATATAALTGGRALPVDAVMIMDTTASMNTSNTSCSISGSTRLTCALAGGRTMMQALSPGVNRMALFTFPRVTSATVVRQYNCNSDQPTIASYTGTGTATYQILPLANDFRTSETSTTLNTASNLVRAFRGGGTGCGQGMAAVGGVGTFYADAITSAATYLNANARTGVQKVIILLSDGDASASSSNMPSGRAGNQCRQAITAATTAKNSGIQIYSIAYGASTSQTGSCGTDSPRISACETMRQIASGEERFYVGNDNSASGCASTLNTNRDLVNVFSQIARSFTQARLLPNNVV